MDFADIISKWIDETKFPNTVWVNGGGIIMTTQGAIGAVFGRFVPRPYVRIFGHVTYATDPDLFHKIKHHIDETFKVLEA